MNTTDDTSIADVTGVDVTPIRRPLGYCPSCGSVRLDPVFDADAEEVHFRCRQCGGYWHVELDHVTRVAAPHAVE